MPPAFSVGWQMQSSEVATGGGEALSVSGAGNGKWYAVNLPSTVLAGLVAAGEYPEMFYSDNLKKVPKERFKKSWWFRKEFSVSSQSQQSHFWVHFKGINYRANIFLNGKQIADSKTIVGAYRDFEIDVTAFLVSGTNVLAVEVVPPDPKVDLAITFVDWAPQPPDLNMGIWQEVELLESHPVNVRHPHVVSNFDPDNPSEAKLTIFADVTNPTGSPVNGYLKGSISNPGEEISFMTKVTLAPGETRTITLGGEGKPPITISNPQLWWPAQLGKPFLYSYELRFTIDGAVSDSAKATFGIRKVTSRIENNSRIFTINGVDLLILGGGYAPDLLQRRADQHRHITYVRDMHLNTVRLEGKLEDDAFYDICDREGVLVMPGWCCCSPWEQWKKWKEEQTNVAMESLRYQIRRARTHPSMIAFLNGSDNPPPANIEQKYLEIEKELNWPCPTISSATAKKTSVTGATGVKMEGPYKWVPPIYWLTDTRKGGAHGFNTEVGPGAVPPPLESLEKMLPAEHRWPIDAVWNFHCGQSEFANLNDFNEAMTARFGAPKSIADFSWKAQAQAYETIKAMYEGFRRNKFNSGGTAAGEIQWMLNNAWPSMIWHLYDYYYRPGAAYFATKQACEPLHILYSYDNRSIVVANDTLAPRPNLTATAEVYDIHASMKHQQNATLDSPANKSVAAFMLTPVADISTTHFLRLALKNSSGQAISTNTYFLSTKPDVPDYNREIKDDWAITPCSSYADFTQLDGLAKVDLDLSGFKVKRQGAENVAEVRVANKSKAIALLTRVKIAAGKDGEEILPVRWSDNYFTLLPGESRGVSARYFIRDALGRNPVVTVDCYNNGRS